MARDVFVDVFMEVSKADLDHRLEQSGQILLDKLRPKADELVATIPGAVLMTDRFSDCRVLEGKDQATGEEMYLVASRWSVVVPDDADLPAGVLR